MCRSGSNSCGYWDWFDEKLPTHVSMMIHNPKIELDSIRKERDHLKKIAEDMDNAEISDLKDMTTTNESSDLEKVSTLEEKMSNLEFKGGNKSVNLMKVDTLDDKVSKLDLKVHQLMRLLIVSWVIIVRFVAAKMI
ncbi:hypothetical protein FXO37_25436 [Capsicum annuum]|nr:hypothetical protein FXO37_25436 [Capsicum annuum]